MGNYIKSWGDYPEGYERAIHGPYDPSVYYGKKDTPFSEVKLGELGNWLGRRNKTPHAMIRCLSRAYWRHEKYWMSPKKPGMAGLYQKIFVVCFIMFLLDYPAYSKHKRYRYH